MHLVQSLSMDNDDDVITKTTNDDYCFYLIFMKMISDLLVCFNHFILQYGTGICFLVDNMNTIQNSCSPVMNLFLLILNRLMPWIDECCF